METKCLGQIRRIHRAKSGVEPMMLLQPQAKMAKIFVNGAKDSSPIQSIAILSEGKMLLGLFVPAKESFERPRDCWATNHY